MVRDVYLHSWNFGERKNPSDAAFSIDAKTSPLFALASKPKGA
jgi:hypothetical protein